VKEEEVWKSILEFSNRKIFAAVQGQKA